MAGTGYDPESDEPWFVNGEGIERRVIQTDLPRYLGNQTTLRAGMGPDNRPGYWYNAYRPLTDQMIASLKADSDRWLNEKRESNRRREPEPDEGWPEYFHSQAWRESRRRAAPIIPELPAPHEPRPEPPPIDPRYPLPDPYGRGTVPPNVGHGGHGGHGGRTVYDPPPPNFAPQNYRADQRYAINPQQQYPSHGHPHDSGPAETQLDPYRNQYPPPKYPGPPNPPSFQPVPDQPQRPQQPQPDHGAYYRDYRQQQPYYPPHGPPSD